MASDIVNKSDDDRARSYVAGPNDEGKRIDRILRSILPRLPLSALYRIIRKGKVLVDGTRATMTARVRSGQSISIALDNASSVSIHRDRDSSTSSATPLDSERFEALVLVETKDLVFINKPWGMLSHGHGGLDELAVRFIKPRLEASLAFVPAPLHRLDRNTTGIVVVSKSIEGARWFSKAMREGRIEKTYIALLDGCLREPLHIVDSLARQGKDRMTVRSSRPDARKAETDILPLASSQTNSLALVSIRSGFTHQIRVQSFLAGYPLSGDGKYGGKPFRGGYILHAARLEYQGPIDIETPAAVVAPLPMSAIRRLKALFGPGFGEKSFFRELLP